MEAKKQPRRIAKTKSLETTFDEGDSDVDEVQRRLDNLLGDVSDGSDMEYDPINDDLDTSDENDQKRKEEANKNATNVAQGTTKKNKRLSTNKESNFKKARLKRISKKSTRTKTKSDDAEDVSDKIELLGAVSKTDEVTSNNDEEEEEDSDDSFIQQIRDSYTQKINSLSSRSALKKPAMVHDCGENRKEPKKIRLDCLNCYREVSLSDLRAVPSLMRTILGFHNPYYYDKNSNIVKHIRNARNHGTRLFALNFVKMEFERLLTGNSQECLNYLVSLLNIKASFWSANFNLQTKEKFDPMVEEAGLMTFRLLQRIISNSSLYAQTILKFGKIADGFRKKGVSKSVRKLILPVTPRSLIGSIKELIGAGDIQGLNELFQNFTSTRSNTENEVELELVRSIVAMMRIIVQDMDDDHLSLGGSSSVTNTSSHAVLPADNIIAICCAAIRENSEVDWFLPLFSSFLDDEKGYDVTKSMLLEYRDDNTDHYPAHQHLLEYLRDHQQDEDVQSLQDESKIRLEAVKCCIEKFPFDQFQVEQYCEILIKRAEDDDELNESFESGDSDEYMDRNKGGEKISHHREIVTVIIKNFDYKSKTENISLWTYLVESLKYLYMKDNKVRVFLSELFKDRGLWWRNQNIKYSKNCSDEVLVKKCIVGLILYGEADPQFGNIFSKLESRMVEAGSGYIKNLYQEFEVSKQKYQTCLMESPEKILMEDALFICSEWEKIDEFKKATPKRSQEKSKNYFTPVVRRGKNKKSDKLKS